MLKDDKILNRIKDIVNQTNPNTEVFLYGSRARGTAKADSDWDVLILLNSDKLTFDLEKSFIDNLYEIIIETGEVISPLVFTKNEWNGKYRITPLFENIQKEGIRL
ncbi:MAG: nucleotidyltransferase domain-containing protein [Bacteroidetes bacterium]|nr:MAG: nucleotidyltransferase domain-containing protein [Bacteroidota bacterium]